MRTAPWNARDWSWRSRTASSRRAPEPTCGRFVHPGASRGGRSMRATSGHRSKSSTRPNDNCMSSSSSLSRRDIARLPRPIAALCPIVYGRPPSRIRIAQGSIAVDCTPAYASTVTIDVVPRCRSRIAAARVTVSHSPKTASEPPSSIEQVLGRRATRRSRERLNGVGSATDHRRRDAAPRRTDTYI